jgi:hypothetical protein
VKKTKNERASRAATRAIKNQNEESKTPTRGKGGRPGRKKSTVDVDSSVIEISHIPDD